MNRIDQIITLISNVRSTTSHENTVAHFITKLSQPLDLEGRWECALCEFIVPGIASDKREEVLGNDQNRPAHVLGTSLIVNVKTDIIEPTIFASSQKRILRSIVIDADPSETGYTHANFESLQFYPMCKRYIREIEIKFELPSGEKVPFAAKRSQVVLCLRKQLEQ